LDPLIKSQLVFSAQQPALAGSSLKPTTRWLPRRMSGSRERHAKCFDFVGAGDGKPPIPQLRAEITGDFSAARRRFVARFVVFRHPLMVRPFTHGG
jgi:hypothetical protein